MNIDCDECSFEPDYFTDTLHKIFRNLYLACQIYVGPNLQSNIEKNSLRGILLHKVILEHDTVMTAAYTKHAVFNSIAYLGSNEQAHQGWGVYATPPHASEGPNYHFICRAHAYAIDPAVAKNMLAHVLKFGITAPLDIILRADIFPMHQMGMYAHDLTNLDTTILGRPKEGRKTDRNDALKN